MGALVLWVLGKSELTAFGQGHVPMAPSTAMVFCGFGLAQFLAVHCPAHRAAQRAAFWIILLGTLVALVLGTLSAFGIRPPVEHLGLVKNPAAIDGIPVGHMSPLTAIAFVLAGLAHLSTPRTLPGRLQSGPAALCFAALLLGLSLLLVLAYLFGSPLLVGTSFIPPALLTSGAFLALGLGLALHSLPHLPPLQDRPRSEVVAGLTYLGVFALVALGTLTISYIHLRHYETELRTAAQRQLITITDLKVRQLAEYRRERLADAFFLMHAPGFSELASQVLGNASDARSAHRLQQWMERLRFQEQYSLLRLVDEQGRVRLSWPPSGPPLGPASLQALTQVLQSGKPQLVDFHLNAQDRHPHIALMVPVPDVRNSLRMRGALALRLEATTFIYPFLKAWPLASRSAETLLVRRDGDEVVVLNELRFEDKGPLQLRMPLARTDHPAVRAALRQEGLVTGLDHRGIPVFASLHQIPESPWALVACIDRSEVLAPVRARVWQLLGLNLLLLATVASGLGLLWRSQRLRTLQAILGAEVELRASEFRFRHAVEEVPFPMMIHAEDGEVITMSRAWTEVSGYSQADIPTIEAWTEKAYGVHRQGVIEEINKLYDLEHRKTEGEYTITCRDGATRIWDFSSVSLGRLPDGRRIALSMAFDVTERKQAEADLSQSYALLAKLANLVPGVVYQYRLYPDGRSAFPYSSPGIEGIYEVTPEEVREDATPVFGRLHPDDYDSVANAIKQSALTLEEFHSVFRVILPRQGLRWRWSQAHPERMEDGGTLWHGIILDITDRKQAEEAMRESENHFRSVVASLSEGIVQSDREGAILAWNPAAEQILGLSGDQLRGHSVIDPRWEAVQEDGRAFPIEEQPARTALRTGLPQLDKVFAVRKADGSLTWISVNAIPVFTPGDPKPSSVVASFSDITERKQAEEEKIHLQAQLQQSQKMESLGTLAGGVAHDMNNVLGAILGLASAHIGTVPYGSPLHRALDTICKATERGGKMVKSLLSFARQSPAESSKLDMNAIIREQVVLLERTTLAKVRLQMEMETELRPILGDASALTHAFMNLCVNAVDAMPDGGTLTLLSRNVDNDWIEVVVKDTGMGMPKEVLEKAMEPFFTTKEIGKGTGLGLSMVFSTVKAHRGQMAIESEPGQGTRVMLRFPACEQAPSELAARPGVVEASSNPHTTRKVLLIDDDDLIQSSVLAILEVLGHTKVSTAQSGEEALSMLEAGLEVDLVFLDMNMPGLGGIGTLPRLRAQRPEVPVLLTTGRVDQTALALASAHPGVTLLSKPFGLRELQKHLENVGLG